MQSNLRTLGTALKSAIEKLAPGSQSAGLDARILLQHVTGLRFEDLVRSPETPLQDQFWKLYFSLIKRREAGEPVAYLTGSKDFWGLPFHVAPGVLIPRPETELLVENALLHFEECEEPIALLDLGVGSGCVVAALAHELRRRERSFVAVGLDRSLPALQIAASNIENLGLADRVLLLASDWLSALDADQIQFDVIVSNPPYIPDRDTAVSPELSFEPRQALRAGEEGMDAICDILQTVAPFLRPGGKFFCEFGYGQRFMIERFLETLHQNFRDPVFHPDLAGLDRVLELGLE